MAKKEKGKQSKGKPSARIKFWIEKGHGKHDFLGSTLMLNDSTFRCHCFSGLVDPSTCPYSYNPVLHAQAFKDKKPLLNLGNENCSIYVIKIDVRSTNTSSLI